MKRLLPLLSLAPLLLVTMGAGPCDSQPLGNVDGGAKADGATYDVAVDAGGADMQKICVDATGIMVPCTSADAGLYDTGVGVKDSAGSLDARPICFDNQGNQIPCPTDGGASVCEYLGKTYMIGSSFPSSDGCNTCSCQTTGSVACTERACFDAGVDAPTTCDYAGVRYVAGATFPSTDGCNTCSCSATGVACTKKACVSDAGTSDGSVITGVCKVGADQTCNEDPVASALRGKCQPDGSCMCAGSGTSGVVSPHTGKCLGPGNTTGEGCEYGGKVVPVGDSFACSPGCNVCTCKAPGTLVSTDIACSDGGATSMCGLDAVYLYGSIGGKVAYQDQVTIAPSTTSPATAATYVLTRSSDGGSSGVSCSPAFPTCGSPSALDVSDVMTDILDSVVQKYLSQKTSTPLLFGLDTRPVDGPIFSFQRGDGHGFLVGAPCNGASGCTEISPPIAKLVADLRALDQQQLQASACAMVVSPPKP
jgi:hypothetical protein